MKIALFLSNFGGSPLVVGLQRGLVQLGHAVEQYRHGYGYDLVLIVNQTAHVTNYVYPTFPPPGLPIAFIDCAEYGSTKRYPDIAHDYCPGTCRGSLPTSPLNGRAAPGTTIETRSRLARCAPGQNAALR